MNPDINRHKPIFIAARNSLYNSAKEVRDKFSRQSLLKKSYLIGLIITALGFGGYSLLPSAKPASIAEDKRPNIIFILFDDATKQNIEMMPNIKTLIADQGATFERFYTTQAQCCPSRSSLLTGEFVHNHGVESNEGDRGGYGRFRALGNEERIFSKNLQTQGYKTALMGKYLNDYGPETSSAKHKPPYWDKWFGKFSQHFYDYSVNEDGKVKDFAHRNADYADTVIGSRAESWIYDQTGPYFAFVSVLAPHAPYNLPPSHKTGFEQNSVLTDRKASFNEADVSDKPKYIRNNDLLSPKIQKNIDQRHRDRLRMMLETDEMVGRLITELDAKGELGNTYIFVASDNGWMEGEHRINADKNVPYEESVHMPLMVRGPGIRPGMRIPELASMADLFATLTDISGSTEQRDGRSLLPLLAGRSEGWRKNLLIEHLSSKDAPKYFGVITDRYKYIEYATGETELYDLIADPYEINSLHKTANMSLISDLKAKLDYLKTCKGDSCRIADSL